MSYQTVKDHIKDFAEMHCFVAQFEAEKTDGLEASGENNYPLVFLNPINKNKAVNTWEYQVQLYIFDYAVDDKFNDIEYCTKKCHKIATDLYDYLSKRVERTPRSFVVNSLMDYSKDKTHGVEVTFDITSTAGCVSSLNDVMSC